jgi:hypothetical protein
MSHAFSIRPRRVSVYLVEPSQRIQSRRAMGVMAAHVACALGVPHLSLLKRLRSRCPESNLQFPKTKSHQTNYTKLSKMAGMRSRLRLRLARVMDFSESV